MILAHEHLLKTLAQEHMVMDQALAHALTYPEQRCDVLSLGSHQVAVRTRRLSDTQSMAAYHPMSAVRRSLTGARSGRAPTLRPRSIFQEARCFKDASASLIMPPCR